MTIAIVDDTYRATTGYSSDTSETGTDGSIAYIDCPDPEPEKEQPPLVKKVLYKDDFKAKKHELSRKCSSEIKKINHNSKPLPYRKHGIDNRRRND